MNIHEYQAKEVLRGFGVPVPARLRRVHRRRGRGGSREARRSGLGGEGADPCRRPRQGRWREGGQVARRGAQGSHPHARHDARHAPDRSAWPRRAPALYRRRLRHRSRTLSLRAGRPRHQPRRVHCVDRRRHGYRRGGQAHARKNPYLPDRAGGGLSALCRARHRRRAEARRAMQPSNAARSSKASTMPSSPRI